MCGINFSFDETKLPLMNEKISHRGIRSKVKGKLGHVRLPIQGLSNRFDGPYDYGKWRIAYVGEIYNYKSIDETANSDIEVLAKEWDENGIDSFRQFDGMWSCIIWDSSCGHYHIITDPLAKKPLYINGDLDVSSEIAPLLNNDKHVEYKKPDPFYYSCVSHFGYCMHENTPYRDIKKIPPGQHMILHKGEIIYSHNYWNLQDEAFLPAFPDETLHSAISKAISNRMVADTGVSVLCSGGIDSSIVYQIARNIDPDVLAIFIENGPEDAYHFDLLDAKNYIKVGLDTSEVEEVLIANEGPVDLGSMMPQYHGFKSIKEETSNPVVLSGDGADELFLGYSRAQKYDTRYYDVFSELVYYHLPRLDKLSMRHTLELRSPFLSWDVVRIALGLNYETGKGKAVLKDLFKGILPYQIIERPKMPLRYKSPRDESWRGNLIKLYRGLAH